MMVSNLSWNCFPEMAHLVAFVCMVPFIVILIAIWIVLFCMRFFCGIDHLSWYLVEVMGYTDGELDGFNKKFPPYGGIGVQLPHSNRNERAEPEWEDISDFHDSDWEEADECKICYKPYKKKRKGASKVSVLPCDHFFHSACIVPLVELGDDCPICGEEVSADELELMSNLVN